VLWESYSVSMRQLLRRFERAGLKVERIVLADGPGFIFRAGGSYYTAGGRRLSEGQVRRHNISRTLRAFGFTAENLRTLSDWQDYLARQWHYALMGYNPYADKVVFTELEAFVPVYVQKWGLDGLGVTDCPEGYAYASPYGFWQFDVSDISTTAALLQYIRLVYEGKKYDLKKVEIMDAYKEYQKNENQVNAVSALYFSDYWIEFGIYTEYYERQDRWTWESDILIDWINFNAQLWKAGRCGLEGESVAGRYIRRFGYDIVTYYYPPWPSQTSMPERQLWKEWADWHRSFLKKRVIGFDTYYPPGRYVGIKNSCAPWLLIGGWDKKSDKIGLYTAMGAGMASFYGVKIFPPGINFYHPMYSVGDWGYIYPKQEFKNIPPVVGIPSRVIAYEGEEVEFQVVSWDAEGEEVSWDFEGFPFQILEKTASKVRFKIDKPAGLYYCWVRYSDGVNTVRHPIVFHIRATLYLRSGQ
jgi:hypothetical protein